MNPEYTNMQRQAPEFYICGTCGHLHRLEFTGDCRNDDERFFPDQLDEMFGAFNWLEVADPMDDES